MTHTCFEVFDSCPPENLYASDLHQEFSRIGHGLFLDHSTLNSQFLAADVFDGSSEIAQSLGGQIDLVNATFFFHKLGWDKQGTACKRIMAVLPPCAGSLLIGRHAGHITLLTLRARPGDGQRQTALSPQ
ncbi:hypothetical protein BDV29DRAFT_154219 [Aspergillus leporis]|jgi:hypothetical protein|uniref:Uncharacterized protein n=1 Tax=Aspergillus leporis TaxID=41062 RepID=A0A5N5X8D2_9EURO|nr:hypothetical protein BDV29DRAFT_154219 [Aspergillus leporis]